MNIVFAQIGLSFPFCLKFVSKMLQWLHSPVVFILPSFFFTKMDFSNGLIVIVTS